MMGEGGTLQDMSDDDIHDWRRDGEDGLEASKQEFQPRREELQEPGVSEQEAMGQADQAGRAEPRDVQRTPAEVRVQAIACPNCRYNLTGATIGMACPECGVVVGSGLLGASAMPTSGKAVASLVLGIVGLVGCCAWGLSGVICGGLAIILTRGVKGQVLRGEVNPSSQGMATAGFVCGLIGFILGMLLLGFMAFAVISGF